MSKLQLLYEKLMKVMFIFAGIFFFLFIIDLFFAMINGAINCSDSYMCQVEDGFILYQYSLYPLLIGTVGFLIAGRIFYSLAYKESKLLTVEEYKAQIAAEEAKEDTVDRENIYEKFKRKETNKNSSIKTWFVDKKEATLSFIERKKQERKRKQEAKKAQKEALLEQREQERKEVEAAKEKAEKEAILNNKGPMNKTGLISHISEHHDISMDDSRILVNTILEIFTEQLIAGDTLELYQFGKIMPVQFDDEMDVEFIPYPSYLQEFDSEDTKETEETIPVPTEDKITDPKLPKDETPGEQAKESLRKEPKEEVTDKDDTKKDVTEKKGNKDDAKTPENEKPDKTSSPKTIKSTPKKTDKKSEKKKPAPKKKTKKKKTRTKTDIINYISDNTDISKNKSNKFLKALAQVVQETLVNRDDVDFGEMGHFTTIEMPEKEAVNPQTQEPIVVPAHHQVRFRFNDDFGDKVNEE
ncbi:MAG: HU family DNA-binding protein [Candidatus Izemoplasma sp.]|nr:HU family DNA-binding protein [Candidatus Izemoplasma sp.]